MLWTFTGQSAVFDGIWWAFALSVSLMVVISLIVSKTGPWWGKNAKPVRKEVKDDIVAFLSNRTATMSDFIDRFHVNSSELRLAVSELTMEGKIVEIDYMTYTLKEHSTPDQVFTKDSSVARDIHMILIAIVAVAGLVVIWNLSH